MKRSGLLNPALISAIASLGHGDTLMVVDAGFPIPRTANRIDLSLVEDVPDLRTVLRAVKSEFIAEGVTIAEEAADNNPELDRWLRSEFSAAEFQTVPHSEMLTVVPTTAKAIVRTGSFEPWGNIALRSGVDVPRWFTKDGVVLPDYYRDRFNAAPENRP